MKVQLSILPRQRKTSIHVVPEEGKRGQVVLVPEDETEGIRVIGLSY